jgi:hypothetical protein
MLVLVSVYLHSHALVHRVPPLRCRSVYQQCQLGHLVHAPRQCVLRYLCRVLLGCVSRVHIMQMREVEESLTTPREAAIIIGYPSLRDRGFYLAIWQTAKAAGPIVGGAINLGLNANRDTAGSVG